MHAAPVICNQHVAVLMLPRRLSAVLFVLHPDEGWQGARIFTVQHQKSGSKLVHLDSVLLEIANAAGSLVASS